MNEERMAENIASCVVAIKENIDVQRTSTSCLPQPSERIVVFPEILMVGAPR